MTMRYLYPILAAICLCAATLPLHAQIVYTDIDPDTTVTATVDDLWKSYFLDLDNDGTFEFEIEHFHPDPSFQAVEIHRNTVGTQQVIINAAGHSQVMTKGDNIDAGAGSWGLDGYGILNAPWYGGGDKYFAIRFQKSGAWHYGWARVAIPADAASVTIKDYAYESSPDTPIECGADGTTGVRPAAEALGLSALQNGRQVTILNERNLTGTATLFSILGERILTAPIDGPSVTLDLAPLSAGAYVLTVTNAGDLLLSLKLLHRP